MMRLRDFVNDVIFRPDRRSYWHPAHFGLKGEGFSCATDDGETLSGLVIQALNCESRNARGTVLFCHAALMNLQFHLPQAAFLAQAGFNVAMFDYRGFGGSAGRSRMSTIGGDARCVLSWIEESPWAKPNMSLFGQGLGCDAALQLLHRVPQRFQHLILEAPYARRGGWLRERWGPLIGDVAARAVKIDEPEPEVVLAEVRTPALVFYPEYCTFVRRGQRRRVAESLSGRAACVEVPGAKFLGIFGTGRTEPQARVLEFLSRHA